MLLTRSRLLVVVISVILSSGLLWLGISRMPERIGGNHAVLVFDEGVSDREIRERLENAGITGLFSESGQYVLLNVFDGLEYIPLDEYENRVLPFDPRNDGYAQKLRSLFVRDEKRYIYFSLGNLFPGKPSLSRLNRVLASEFNNDSYSLEVIKSKKTTVLSLVLFGIAICAFFVIRPLRSVLLPGAAFLIPCMLTLAPLAPGGAAGFAMAALLAGLAVFFAEFHREKRILFRRNRETVNIPPSLIRILLLSLFLVCYAVLAFFSGLPFFLPLLVLFLFCGVLFCSIRLVSDTVFDSVFANRPVNRQEGHRRFSPVQIISRNEYSFSFAWVMLPFIVPAFILALTGFETSSISSDFPFPPPDSVCEADWQNHFYYQSNFSNRTLNEAESEIYMSEYIFSQDGLLAPVPVEAEVLSGNAFHPFPLDDFLSTYQAVNLRSKTGQNNFASYEILCVLVPMLFVIPALVRRRDIGKKGARKWLMRNEVPNS